MARRWLVTAGLSTVLVMVPVVAVAGGGGSMCAGFARGGTIDMRDNCFSATALFASPGQQITVHNDGGMEHSYTAVDGTFDTGILVPGESTTITSPDDGLVRVYCTVHSSRDGEGMAGVLIVDEADIGDAQLTSTTAATPSVTANVRSAVWPAAAAAVLGSAALAVGLRANRRLTVASRDERRPSA